MKIFLIPSSSSNIDEKRAKFFTIIFQLFDHLIIQHVRQVAAFRFRVDLKGDGAPLRFLISHFSPPDFHSPSLRKIFCFILASGSSIGDFDESTETSVINFFPPMSLSFPRWQPRELFLKRDFFAHRWMETRANYWWGTLTRILRSARMQGTTSVQRFQLPALACSREE